MGVWAWVVRECEARGALTVPLVGSEVKAGFPSPAEDYVERPLDFNELLIANPAATFAVRVAGDSMSGDGILPGDIAVVDRSVQAANDRVILALVDGEFTLKRYRRRREHVWLQASNPAYKPIPITDATEFECWGSVRAVVRVL